MKDPARGAVLDALGAAIERWHARERKFRKAGQIAEAEGAHQYLEWAQRAYKAEFHNPPPRTS